MASTAATTVNGVGELPGSAAPQHRAYPTQRPYILVAACTGRGPYHVARARAVPAWAWAPPSPWGVGTHGRPCSQRWALRADVHRRGGAAEREVCVCVGGGRGAFTPCCCATCSDVQM